MKPHLGLNATPAFRMACLFAAGTLVLICILFAFVYWQTALFAQKNADDVLVRDARLIEAERPEEAARSVERRISADFHRVLIASVFDAHGTLIAGNLSVLPRGLALDGRAHRIPLDGLCCDTLSQETGRILARKLRDGRILVIGRNVDTQDALRHAVKEALLAGMTPALILALGIGWLMGKRTSAWLDTVQTSVHGLERGEIWQRLPVPETNDSNQWLVQSFNRILDRVGLVLETAQSKNIHLAHDLLSPLAGVRSRLERASQNASDVDELRNAVGLSITSLDHTVKLASAFLKIGSIERGHLRQAFRPVSLSKLISDLAELFSVMAEDKRITFTVSDTSPSTVQGDHGLLMEAVANLVDNAIKYTPPDGTVHLYVSRRDAHLIIGVRDTGPGLDDAEQDRVLKRFYRHEPCENTPGYGIGLSLVEAVVRLHGFSLRMENGSPGLIVEIVCSP